MAIAAREPSPPPLPLWQALRAELRHLRPECRELADPAFDDPARAEGEQLGRLFAIVNAWKRPPGSAPDTTPSPAGFAAPAAPPAAPSPSAAEDQRALAALCFSGGGIRSATFNLGVLQGFARLGLLDRFDYLSSVSGGGYIASWLARWVKEDGIEEVTRQLADRPADPSRPEPAPLTHLRQFSNYITPRLGFLSGDTWTMVAIVLRNVILNWVVLLPLLAAPLLLPLLTVATWPVPHHPLRLLLAAAACELVGLFFLSVLRTKTPAVRTEESSRAPAWRSWYLQLGLVPRLAAMPPLLAGIACLAPAVPDLPPGRLYLYCACWSLGLPLAALLASAPLLGRKVSEIAWDALAETAAGGTMAALYALVARQLLRRLLEDPHHLYAVLGPGVILGTMLAGRLVLVAVSSVSEHWQSIEFGDADREWWSRWSAWTLIVLVVWMSLSGLVLFASTLLATARAAGAALLSAAGSGSLVALLGRGGATPESKRVGETSQVKRLAVTLATPVFAIALVLSLAWGGQRLLDAIWPTGDQVRAAAQETASRPEAGWVYVHPYIGRPANEVLAIAGLLLFGWFAGYPINLNRFSMQAGYRNRLIRAYPGASNPRRRPNPFTGFDPRDNVLLAQLAGNRPFPVINMALNLVHGDDLAWQQRKAECFTATPLHCGAERLGYRETGRYGGRDGITLGTAIATSGAAANPNMGLYTTSAAVTFIMTLFNVRLGIWLGNPSNVGPVPTWRRSGPRFSARELIAEAFGLTNDRHPYVNLSDGGHFEDLGLYEMVRRRCRIIVVSDAGTDPSYAFDDLGNAIRKIRIDFGIPISFSGVRILPKQDSGQPAKGARYCAIGTIDYGAVDGDGAMGTLIYFKPAICEGAPFDVENYARESKTFPHESTSDQWFNETQFESYRALGEAAVQAKDAADRLAPATLEQYVERIERYLAVQVTSRAAAPQ